MVQAYNWEEVFMTGSDMAGVKGQSHAVSLELELWRIDAATQRSLFQLGPHVNADLDNILNDFYSFLISTLRKSGGVLFPRGNAQAGKHAASSRR